MVRTRFSPGILFLLLGFVPVVSQAALNVFACEPEWASLAQELGGERLNIYSATTSMQDPHHIQARPGLIAKARRADLLICTGAELEQGWLPLLLRKARNTNVQPGKLGHLMAADHVELLDKPAELDRSAGDVHVSGNPHMHLNPENILKVANALHLRLINIDEAGEVEYRDRYALFEKRWQEALSEWNKKAEALRGLKIITHHKYWLYLSQWLGLQQVATLEPLPGVSPSSSYLAKIKKQVAAGGVSCIIHASYVNPVASEWLSSKTGIPAVSLPASVNFQQGETLKQWYGALLNKISRCRNES